MREEKILFLDIGNEAVKARVARETAIQYYDRFGVFDGRDFEKDVAKKAILKAAEDCQGQAQIRAKSVILALPPDILRADVSHLSLGMKNPKQDVSREILEKNKKEVSESFFQGFGILPQELEFLDQLFLDKKIDGYRVPSFKGYEGKEAQAQILSVFSTKEELKKYRNIFQELGMKILKIVHPVQNLTESFGEKDGVFLDVGGEITQIFAVKGKSLQKTFGFPMGGRDFSKALVGSFGLSEERARVLKERYSRGEMTEDSRRKFNEILADVAQEWRNLLEIRLKSFEGQLSRRFFLFGGSSRLPEIAEVLEEDYPLEILKNPQEINLILLSHNE